MSNTKRYLFAKIIFLVSLLLVLMSTTLNRFFASDNYEVSVLYKEQKSFVVSEGNKDDAKDVSILRPVNINSASLEELTRLTRVGPVIGQRIIDYRNANGPFEQPEDLLNVKGIGPKIFEANIDMIVLSE